MSAETGTEAQLRAGAWARWLGWGRGVRRVALLSVTTGALYGIYLGGYALRRDRIRRAAFRSRMIQRWARTSLWVLGARIRESGPPPESSLVVSNHLSYLDILVLGSRFPSLFVSKAEVARWPVMGLLARTSGTIFVDRDRKRDLPKVASQIAGELEAGSSVVLFPEGTSSGGADLLPFRPSLLAPAAQTGRPVRYASLRYQAPPGHPPASQCLCWWGDMAFGGHFWALLRLPYFDADVRFGAEPVGGTDRKVLADHLWHAVRNLFEPTT